MDKVEINGTFTVSGKVSVSRAELIREILIRPGRAIVALPNVKMTGAGFETLTELELHALMELSSYVANHEGLDIETLNQVVAAEFKAGSIANINREHFPRAVTLMIELTKDEDD